MLHRILMACRAFMEDQDLSKKFAIIASAPWTEPLGFCGLASDFDYSILHMERVCNDYAFVDIGGHPAVGFRYRLPCAYGEMVNDADIDRLNSGARRNTIRSARKVCGPNRIPYDHKRFYVGPRTAPHMG